MIPGVMVRPTALEALLVAGLVLSSAGTIDQYAGLGAVLAYAAAVAVLVPLAVRRGLPLLLRHLDERRALALAGALFVGVVAVVVVVYPHVNVHSGVRGSDRDDAANLAAGHLLDLEYPYSTP